MVLLTKCFRLVLAGPTGCGKTFAACRIIRNLESWTGERYKVIWCHGGSNEVPENLPENVVSVCEGIPDLSTISPSNGDSILIVLDDMMYEAARDKTILDVFTKGRHKNISVMLLSQNLFHQSQYMRDISLNATYICIFKNPRDPSQFAHLCRQMYPSNAKGLMEVYKEVMSQNYGHIFLDFSQDTPDLLRVKSDIFNPVPSVYVPNEEFTDFKIV